MLAQALTEVVGGQWKVFVTVGASPGDSGGSVAPVGGRPPVAGSLDGFAPGDGPADEIDLTDPPDTEGARPAAMTPPSPPPAEDPVALAQKAFGATVISDTDAG